MKNKCAISCENIDLARMTLTQNKIRHKLNQYCGLVLLCVNVMLITATKYQKDFCNYRQKFEITATSRRETYEGVDEADSPTETTTRRMLAENRIRERSGKERRQLPPERGSIQDAPNGNPTPDTNPKNEGRRTRNA